MFESHEKTAFHRQTSFTLLAILVNLAFFGGRPHFFYTHTQHGSLDAVLWSARNLSQARRQCRPPFPWKTISHFANSLPVLMPWKESPFSDPKAIPDKPTVDRRNPAPVVVYPIFLQAFNHPFGGVGFRNHPLYGYIHFAYLILLPILSKFAV